jgi:2-oxoglutarate ferredoxin oxidoreductase subunit alpha
MARELISTGNELAAKAAIDADVEFFGGYPITPSSEIMHVLSSAYQLEEFVFKWKMKFLEFVQLGAAMSGKRSMTASSGPGISLKAENLGVGYISEVPL